MVDNEFSYYSFEDVSLDYIDDADEENPKLEKAAERLDLLLDGPDTRKSTEIAEAVSAMMAGYELMVKLVGEKDSCVLDARLARFFGELHSSYRVKAYVPRRSLADERKEG
jgi:hypothetical protein